MITRRKLVTGLAAFIAAPAIIRVADLMPVRAWNDGRRYFAEVDAWFTDVGTGATPVWVRLNLKSDIYDDWSAEDESALQTFRARIAAAA